MKNRLLQSIIILGILAGLQLGAVAAERTPPIPRETVNPITGLFTPSTDDFVALYLHIDAQGNVTRAMVRNSTDKRLEKPSLKAVRQWKYIPATRNGVQEATKIVQPIHFGASRLRPIDTKAFPINSPMPVIAETLEDIDAEVSIAVSIDSAGFITKINPVFVSDERFRLPVLDAIREWNYEPARRKGKAVASRQIQTFVFGKGISPHLRTKDDTNIVEGMSINPVIQRGVKSLDIAEVEAE